MLWSSMSYAMTQAIVSDINPASLPNGIRLPQESLGVGFKLCQRIPCGSHG
jgi:hypothetical protein